MISQQEFERLIASCNEIAGCFPDGIAYIGGIAVYLHAINNGVAKLAEFTHDADFYISMADASDLREIEELTTNRRLSKHQFIKNGFEFDVYTERQSSLIVPYDAIMARSVDYDGIRVAGLEHLFALKLEAYRDRQGSAKGSKDAKDLIRIALIAENVGFDDKIAASYLGDEHIELLKRLKLAPEISAMAMGNAVVAKQIRRQFTAIADRQIEIDKISKKPTKKTIRKP